MALFGGRARDVAPRFLAAQAQQQGLAWLHAVEGESRANEGHGASVGGDVQPMIAVQFFIRLEIFRFWSVACHEFPLSRWANQQARLQVW